jgi:predicted lipoprotein with Yx(FWY)xxD motif
MIERESPLETSKREISGQTEGPMRTRFTAKRRTALVLFFALIIALLVGTHLFTSSPSSEKAQVVVKTHSTTRFGKILVTRGGFTVYTYNLDKRNHSNCYAFCLQVWPPLIVSSGLHPIGHGVSGLGAITRSNGQRQVTYEGKPLYVFALDHVPGRISGEGNGWSVVKLP